MNAPAQKLWIRRWFRFSLRSLLIVVTLSALLLGYYAWRLDQRQQAISAIEAIGGEITYDTSGGEPNWLEKFLSADKFRRVLSISLNRKEATDEHLEYVARFPRLTHLILNNTKVTDAGMGHLSGLNELVWLELEYTEIGDEGIVHLNDIHSLITLRLTGTKVTSVGLERITPLATNLRELWIERTEVSQEEAQAIKQSWPNTTILTDQGVVQP